MCVCVPCPRILSLLAMSQEVKKEMATNSTYSEWNESSAQDASIPIDFVRLEVV